jgi:hypothetical protein
MLETQDLIGFAFIIGGVLLIRLRMFLAPRAANLYRKLGIEVPDELYAKQFTFIGVMMMLFGFLIVTRLIHSL